jgi:hypothetical protein
MSNGCSAFNRMPAIQTLSGGFPNRRCCHVGPQILCALLSSGNPIFSTPATIPLGGSPKPTRIFEGWVVVYRLSGAEKSNFEPPNAKIGSPVFSNNYKLALLNRIVK